MTPLEHLECSIPNYTIHKRDFPRFHHYPYEVIAIGFWGISGRGLGADLKQAVERALRIYEIRKKRFYKENGAKPEDLLKI